MTDLFVVLLGKLLYKPGPMSGFAHHHGHRHPTLAGSERDRMA
jgi:hypothetical protein